MNEHEGNKCVGTNIESKPRGEKEVFKDLMRLEGVPKLNHSVYVVNYLIALQLPGASLYKFHVSEIHLMVD